jgi:hypothetical protein
MQIIKTVEVKVVSIGPAKVRPTTNDIVAAKSAGANVSKDARPAGAPVPAPVAVPASKDGMVIVLAAVDNNGRFLNRISLSLCEGKLSTGSTDLGTAPDSLSAALATAFAEVENAASALIEANKLNL